MSPGDGRIGPVRSDIEARDVGHCLAVYVPHTQRAITLNRTAADVYLLSTGEYDLEGMVRLLASSYGLTAAEIQADVAAAVDSLRAEEIFAD